MIDEEKSDVQEATDEQPEAYSEEEKQKIKDRLQSLGYID